jgi:hypothetical protein
MHLVSESSPPYNCTRTIHPALGKAPTRGLGIEVQPRHWSSSKSTKYVKQKSARPLPHLNPPPLPTELSCTTAPPWGQGDWNATEPPANTRDQTKFNNWNFISKLFSRKHARAGGLAACQSNPPLDGAVVYDDIHIEGRGMDCGNIHKLKSNLSECSYLHSLLRCRIRTSLPR